MLERRVISVMMTPVARPKGGKDEMLSWRLWQQVSRPDSSNPIIRRFGNAPRAAQAAERKSRWRRLMWGAAALGLIVIVLNPAQIFVLLFVTPMLMITLAAAAPLLLPLAATVSGALLAAEVIAAIVREKAQHTYELMCACPEGALYANWSCAIGVAHRGGWFSALRWGTAMSLRLGLIGLGGLMLLGLGLLASDQQAIGAEQLRIILVYAMLLGLYGAQLAQSLPLSLIIGLLASSFDWRRRDAQLIGAFLYLVCQTLPMMLALLAYGAGSRAAVDAHPALRIGIELGSLLVFASAREVVIVAMWGALRRRLDAPGVNANYRDNRVRSFQAELRAES